MKYFKALVVFMGFLAVPWLGKAQVKIGDPAPPVKVKTHTGEDFDLGSRKGQWTVLFFYPKAHTPGCTKQACAFRDNVEHIRKQGAEVFGISADTVEKQKSFHEKHHLGFTLLADPQSEIIKAYGAKMPGLKMSKRWTFIIDPDLKIAAIEKNVDPVVDAQRVAAALKEMAEAQ